MNLTVELGSYYQLISSLKRIIKLYCYWVLYKNPFRTHSQLQGGGFKHNFLCENEQAERE